MFGIIRKKTAKSTKIMLTQALIMQYICIYYRITAVRVLHASEKADPMF